MNFVNLIVIMLAITSASNCLVVFKAYRDPACVTLLKPSGLYLPVTDRAQGLDSYVKNLLYPTVVAPNIVGQFTIVNKNEVTFCQGSICKTWKVDDPTCVSTPMFAYGRFYNVDGPGMMLVERTSGQLNTWAPEYCNSATEFGWVVYLHYPLLNSTSPCPTTTEGAFWDGGSKLTYYKPGLLLWTKSQPCGTGPFPGEKCFGSGLGYCTINANCAIDHTSKPAAFTAGSYTLKVTTENRVDSTSLITTVPGSANKRVAAVGLTVIMLLFLAV
ncbi:hypothetical protein OAB94_02200 [Flavobacteriaceae bacterium]|nr:hypothetical protein [Flavobacteriaceae bacterium]